LHAGQRQYEETHRDPDRRDKEQQGEEQPEHVDLGDTGTPGDGDTPLAETMERDCGGEPGQDLPRHHADRPPRPPPAGLKPHSNRDHRADHDRGDDQCHTPDDRGPGDRRRFDDG
jgi:hypothetical protein